MKDNKHTQGEWHLNNPTDDNGNIIIKRNSEYDDQEYFAITIKNSFNLVGFYYPSSKQSESEMIANAKIICQSVNEYSKLERENERYEKAITSLTPGGSEFVNDPEYCVKHVKEFQASQHKLICDLVREKKYIKKENEQLSDALGDILNWLRIYETVYYVNEESVIKANKLLANIKTKSL